MQREGVGEEGRRGGREKSGGRGGEREEGEREKREETEKRRGGEAEDERENRGVGRLFPRKQGDTNTKR